MHSPELGGSGHGSKPCARTFPQPPGRVWGGSAFLGDSCQEMG